VSQDSQTGGQPLHTGNGAGVLKLGLGVFLVLAVLTGIEYAIAKEIEQNVAPLVAIAIVKAALILWYFMHLARAWKSEHTEA
jgi:caa(3)-type oxidase subunit IV